MYKRLAILLILVFLASGCISSSQTFHIPEPRSCDNEIAQVSGLVAKAQSSESATVTRVVDGDTVELADLSKVRLGGINTPEKNENYFAEAKENLESLILDKQVYLQKDITDKDQYGRYLRYIFTTDKFVNAEQVSAGLASSYEYPPDIKYRFLFDCLEKSAREKGIGIWKGYGLYNFSAKIHQNPDTSSNPNDEYITITNYGNNVNMKSWLMKDAGTHIYTFGDVDIDEGKSITIYSGKGNDAESTKYWNQATTVWNNDGDTVFIRDGAGNLAMAYAY
ncbi:MAG: thermonuclease family protein [archaeon]